MDVQQLNDEEGGDVKLMQLTQNLQLSEVECQDCNNTQTISFPTWLEDYESPFLWNSQHRGTESSQQMIFYCEDHLNTMTQEGNLFSLQRFAVKLMLVVEYTASGNIKKAQTIIVEMENDLESFGEIIKAKYDKFKGLLTYLVLSTKAHLLALQGEEVKSKEIAKGLAPFHELADADKIGLYAIKSRFFRYSVYEEAENYARKTLELDSNNYMWLYQLAQVLRLQRKNNPHFLNHHLLKEELYLLEKAIETHKTSKYLQHLAGVYREYGSSIHRQNKNQSGYYDSEAYRHSQEMQKKALHYYKEALAVKPNGVACLKGVGHGLMNLPSKLADYDLAIKCLLKSLELGDNMIIRHMIGSFYFHYGNDYTKAIEHFEEAVNFRSVVGLKDLIRSKYNVNPDYNPIEDLEKGLMWDLRKSDRIFLLTQEGAYYLLIKHNLIKSIEYFDQVVLEDKDSSHMTKFKSLFLHTYGPINLYSYLINEALLYIYQHKYGNDSEKVQKLNLFYNKIISVYPDLANMKPDSHLIERLCKSSAKIKWKEELHKVKPNSPKGPKENVHNIHSDLEPEHSWRRDPSTKGIAQSLHYQTDGYSSRTPSSHNNEGRRFIRDVGFRRGEGTNNYYSRRVNQGTTADLDKNWRKK